MKPENFKSGGDMGDAIFRSNVKSNEIKDKETNEKDKKTGTNLVQVRLNN